MKLGRCHEAFSVPQPLEGEFDKLLIEVSTARARSQQHSDILKDSRALRIQSGDLCQDLPRVTQRCTFRNVRVLGAKVEAGPVHCPHLHRPGFWRVAKPLCNATKSARSAS